MADNCKTNIYIIFIISYYQNQVTCCGGLYLSTFTKIPYLSIFL